MPAVLGWGALTAVLLATFEYTGSSLRGFRPTQGFDEYERKEMMRKNRRRPIEETIAEVGEGRCRSQVTVQTPRSLLVLSTDVRQLFALLGMRNDGERGSRRNTVSTSAPCLRTQMPPKPVFLSGTIIVHIRKVAAERS